MRFALAVTVALALLPAPAGAQSFIKDMNLPPFEQCINETAAVIKLTHPYRDFDLTEVSGILRHGLETDMFADVDFAKVERAGSSPENFRTEFKTYFCSSLHDYYVDGATPKRIWTALLTEYPQPTADDLKTVGFKELAISIGGFTSMICAGAMKVICKDAAP